MPARISLVGKLFGRLKVIADGPIVQNKWNKFSSSVCLCSCGRTINAINSNLIRGGTKSCGCLQRELLSKRCTTHGHSHRNKPTKTYYSWRAMMKRCYNPNDAAWNDYGGRGIGVCERWRDFSNFLAHMGECPPGLTLGRKNNDGDYEPGNCEWQTDIQQNRNKRTNRVFTINGFTGCASELALRFSIKASTAIARIDKRGWSPERAFTTPVIHK